MRNSKLLGNICAFVSALVWGTTFIVTKGLMENFNAAEILFVRYIIAFVILSLMGHYERPQGSSLKDEWIFFLIGLSGLFLYGVLEIFSMEYTYASNTSTIICSNPFFTAVMAVIFLKEKKPGWLFFIGFIVAMSGIGIISFNGASEFGLNPKGDILALLCAISWGVYTTLLVVAGKKGYSTLWITRRTYLWGSLMMLVSLPIFKSSLDMSRFASTSVLLSFLFLGVVASCICFLTWNYATKALGPVASSVYIYIIPVITIIFAGIFLGEKLNVVSALGIVLVLLGTVLSSLKTEGGKKC